MPKQRTYYIIKDVTDVSHSRYMIIMTNESMSRMHGTVARNEKSITNKMNAM
jgi:hypothetical protein